MKKKKFYIGVDCEGVACVVGTPGHGLHDSVNYPFAAKQAAREANAAARALFDSGAQEVIVWDNHGAGMNFDYDLIDRRCRIAMGSGARTRFASIDDSFGGVLFVGYHAREGTRGGVLAHTYSSVTYQYFKVNGLEVGEMEIDAAFAGAHGVPVIFAASDRAAIAQARQSFPWIEAVETKEGLAWNQAISLSPAAACDAIYSGVQRACLRLEEMQAYTFQTPLALEIRFKRLDDANAAPLYDLHRNPFRFVDAFTRAGTLARTEDIRN